MRIKLSHRLRFNLPEASRSLTYILRLTPRSHDGQRVMRWRIDVEPDCRLKATEDHYGNLTHTLTIPGPIADARVLISGELATFDVAGIVRGAAERLPCEIFLRDTPATSIDSALRAFAEDSTVAATDRLGKLHALMTAVHETIEIDQALRPVAAAEALVTRKGTGQDLVHIFIACARHLGWPTRCVTGYYVPHEQDQTRHAWAEVQVDGLGWVAFDPVYDICPQDMHIRTAIGLDAVDAAGLRGTRIEGLSEKVEATWRFERDMPSSSPAPLQASIQTRSARD